MLGRSVASKMIYVRPVGGPENNSNIREKPNINNSVPLTLAAPVDFYPQTIYGTFSALIPS